MKRNPHFWKRPGENNAKPVGQPLSIAVEEGLSYGLGLKANDFLGLGVQVKGFRVEVKAFAGDARAYDRLHRSELLMFRVLLTLEGLKKGTLNGLRI